MLDDPLALRIDPHVADQLRADTAAFDTSPVSPFLRAFFAVRSRVVEDELRDAVARAVRQYAVCAWGRRSASSSRASE